MMEAVDKDVRKSDLFKNKRKRVTSHYFISWNGREAP
jgi:hypothetical protein